jgi:hypothetical protein
MTPHDNFINWKSDEYSQLKVSWYTGNDLTDYDEINEEKQHAFRSHQIFAIFLNSNL